MIFCIKAKDAAEKNSIREEKLFQHREYLAEFKDQISFAGPLLDHSGKQIVGSLLVMEFSDISEARKFIECEPYNKSGLFESVEIFNFENRWKQMVGFPSN